MRAGRDYARKAFDVTPWMGPTRPAPVAVEMPLFAPGAGGLTGELQQFPVDLNQDGFRGPGEALWH
jgi:hypothetical protein